MTYDINDLKELTTAQLDAAREAALKRVQARIGSRPRRQNYRREYGPLLSLIHI